MRSGGNIEPLFTEIFIADFKYTHKPQWLLDTLEVILSSGTLFYSKKLDFPEYKGPEF